MRKNEWILTLIIAIILAMLVGAFIGYLAR